MLTQGKLTRLVPVENAAMPDRSIIQWDKDDLDDMGLLKVDVLALGMLTALRRCLDFVSQRRGYPFALQDIEDKDEATYDMICRADTVGVFQIESRAQMSMLPRLRPREFYDLVIEVAIVRPGPIQGGMIHPYLKSRERLRDGEEIRYENEALKPALERTLGVPIFQEQVMQIAMIAAGFSADEADRLRRSMAAWKRRGGVHQFQDRLIDGMLEKGYTPRVRRKHLQADPGLRRIRLSGKPRRQLRAAGLRQQLAQMPRARVLPGRDAQFAADGFLFAVAAGAGRPGAMACRCCRPTCRTATGTARSKRTSIGVRFQFFAAGGAAGPADGRRPERSRRPTRGRGARAQAPFASTEDLALRAQLDVKDLNALAAGDALLSLSGHRRQQVWDAAAQRGVPALLQDAPVNEEALALPAAPEGEEIVFDYASLGLTLRRHPLALLRPRLARMKLLSAAQLHDAAERPPRARLRHRHRAPAAADGPRHHLRHAGRRDRAGQCDRLEIAARAAAR